MKCVNCKNCVGFENGYYFCKMYDGYRTEWEMIEECIANNDLMECDFYVDDMDDDD